MDPFTIASAGTQLFGAVGSLISAGNAKKEQRKAEMAADAAIAEARKKMSVNYLEAVQLPMDAYTEAFNANTAAQKQTVEMLAEGDARVAAAGAGRAIAQSQRGNELIRQQMSRDIYGRDLMVAKEDANIASNLAETYKDEAAGANTAALNYEQQRAGYMNNFLSGVSGAGMSILGDAALYSKKEDASTLLSTF